MHIHTCIHTYICMCNCYKCTMLVKVVSNYVYLCAIRQLVNNGGEATTHQLT